MAPPRDRPPGRAPLSAESLESRDNPAAIFATGVAAGGAPVVPVYDAATKTQEFTVTAYDLSFTGGVNVAVGDVNGDGTPDVITGTGVGGGPVVNVFSGVDGTKLGSLTAGDADSRAGVTVAAADYDGDGKADVVVGTVRNGEPLVQVIRFADQTVLHWYTPFTGVAGAFVATGDVDGDGVPDTVVGAGADGSPRVVVYSGASDAPLSSFLAFEDSFTGGVSVAAGDVNADGKADVVAAAGPGGGPRVQVFNGLTGAAIVNFFAYDSSHREGATATVFSDNGTVELVTAEGTDPLAQVRAFDPSTLAEMPAPAAGVPSSGAVSAAPTATVATTAGTATNAAAIPFTATFSKAVNGFAAAGLAITNGAVGAFTPVDARTYTFTVTPVVDGEVTVGVAAGAATDAAGTGNATSGSVSVTADRTAPTVIATALTTNTATPTLTGTVDDPAAAVTVEVAGQSLTATVSGSTWSATPTSLAAGTYDVQVSATDAAGNTGTASQPGGLVVDLTAPFATLSSAAADPTTTDPIPVTVAFNEPVTGFSASGILVGNGTVTNFVQSDAATYTFGVVPTGSGGVSVSVPAGVAADAAGNPNPASDALTRTFGGTVTTAVVTTTAAEPTNAASIPVTVTFGGDVTGFTVSGLSVTNGTAENFVAVSGSEYTFDVVPTVDGAVTVAVPAGAATDTAGNPTAAGSLTVTSDRAAPAAAVTGPAAPANAGPLTFTVAFTEPVVGFGPAALSADNGTVGLVTPVGDHTYSVEVAPAADGTVTLNVLAGAVADGAGNVNAAAAGTATFDTTAPTAAVTTTAGDPTNGDTIPVSVTFSAAVTGFDLSDVTVQNGAAGNFTVASGTTYTFDVTPTADGAVVVTVGTGPADAAGNAAAAASLTVTSDRTPPTGTVTAVSSDAGTTTFTVSFGESVADPDTAKLSVADGTLGTVTRTDDRTFILTAVSTSGQPATLTLLAGATTDAAGNPSPQLDPTG